MACPGGGAGSAPGLAAGAVGAVCTGAAVGSCASSCETRGASLDLSRTIKSPSLTLSPTAMLTDSTMPVAGAGISMVALSLSSVTSGSSGSTSSPALTMTSMTSTFSKSPMSGTTTSSVCDGVSDGAGDGEDTAAGAAGAWVLSLSATASIASSVTMRAPSPTWSPTLTWIAETVPDCGAGISMVALSLSSVMRGSSGATLSPG